MYYVYNPKKDTTFSEFGSTGQWLTGWSVAGWLAGQWLAGWSVADWLVSGWLAGWSVAG